MTRYEALRFAVESLVRTATEIDFYMALDTIEVLAYELHLCRPDDSGEDLGRADKGGKV